MKKELSVKSVVAIGIGSAIFVILGRFVTIPTGIPNTNIETTYPFLALFGVLYGPVVGFATGFIGHALKDFITFGNPWWSWVICSGLIGGVFGLIGKRLHVEEGTFNVRDIVFFNICQVIANFVTWGLIAPTLDILVYSEPVNKVFLQGLVTSTSNSLTIGILGTLLIKAYAATRVKKGSLHKD